MPRYLLRADNVESVTAPGLAGTVPGPNSRGMPRPTPATAGPIKGGVMLGTLIAGADANGPSFEGGRRTQWKGTEGTIESILPGRLDIFGAAVVIIIYRQIIRSPSPTFVLCQEAATLRLCCSCSSITNRAWTLHNTSFSWHLARPALPS